MVMLSKLLHFRIIDAQEQINPLADVVIGQLDVDYPLVTHLIYRANYRSEHVLPWGKVKTMDQANGLIHIENFGPGQDVEPVKNSVRVRRDVLDALILDLQNRRVTRANDLWFDEKDGQLCLSAADTGARAILRRLTRGWYQSIDRDSLYDWKYIEFLRGDPQAVKAGASYQSRIVRLPPGEIAHLTANIPYLHAAELLALLPEQLAADTLEVMAPERQLQVFEELEDQRALELLKRMAPDLAADIVGRLDTKLARLYLNRLPKVSAERIIELLQYPENTVGGIMTNDVVTLSPGLTIGEARHLLREKLNEPDFVYFLYVIEDQPPHKLYGVITLRQFLMARDDQTIEEIMNRYLITLSPFDSPNRAGFRLLNSQLAALPVVGEQGQLVGMVTIDAAVSQVAPRSWRAQAPRVFS